MSRTLPTECPHGRTLDWGDFGPDPDDGSVGAEHCPWCNQPQDLVDRYGPAVVLWLGRLLMASGSVLAALSTIGLVRDPNIGWVAVLAGNGVICVLGVWMASDTDATSYPSPSDDPTTGTER
ncbi:MAG TPA: hypothetical protein VK611_24905 [Acidimicrobiales bacterium]|nr:hypothetical protein [Acidimicrobiales bacterium]